MSHHPTPMPTANNSTTNSRHTTPVSPLSPFVYMLSNSCNEPTSPCLLPNPPGLPREPTHMIALQLRRKKFRVGSLASIQQDMSRPSCEFIHCGCAECQLFRKTLTTWQPGTCHQVVGCMCPRCQRYFASGHWDPFGPLIHNFTWIWRVLGCLKIVL